VARTLQIYPAASVRIAVVADATAIPYTTGRGTAPGSPVPPIKISSNTAIFEPKPHWIGVNSGYLLDGSRSMTDLRAELFKKIIETASGSDKALDEIHDYREIAIWKEAATL